MLTSSEIMELANCSDMLLQRWATAGVLTPIVNGRRGRGRQRQYSMAQAVALVYGTQMTELGWSPPGHSASVKYLARLSDQELQKHMRKGETLLVAPGVWVNPSTLNLDQTQRKVIRDIELTRAYSKVRKHIQRQIVCNSRHDH